MAGSKPVKPTPQQVQDAEGIWQSFMAASKYVIIFTVVVLIGLAAAFVPW